MEKARTTDRVHEEWRAPATDAWIWLSILVLAASLGWTVYVFVHAATSDPCASSGDQCLLAFWALWGWLMPQLFAAVPSIVALIILIRYFARGNTAVPRAGFAVLGLNVIASVALLVYVSTLPMYFR